MNLYKKTPQYIILKALALSLAIFSASSISCKKEIAPDPEPEPEPIERTEDEEIRDLVYYYYKRFSLWTDKIPAYNPISDYTNQFTSPELVLADLIGLTRVDAINDNYDHYSYLDKLADSGTSMRADNADGYGMYTTVVRTNPDEMVGYVYIFFVEGGSPAAAAGIKRGDKIVKINDRDDITISLGGTTTNPTVSDTEGNLNYISNALDGDELTIEVERGTIKIDKELTYKTYPINPIITDTTFVRNGSSIGYLAMSSFEELSGNQAPNLRQQFSTIFNSFESQNVDKLILDFRYNIGGYVNTAEHLLNILIPSRYNDELMFSYLTNDTLKQEKYIDSLGFEDVKFEKTGNLELSDIYFLVTEDNTASASEIVISSLMPYFNHIPNQREGNLHIIAETNRTYGKPVGFFPTEIMGKYDLWVSSFKCVNANGYTDYFQGIPANRSSVIDNVLRDFGDPQETMIATALNHISTGSYTTASSNMATSRSRSTNGSSQNAQKIKNINNLKPKNLIKR